MNNKVRVRFAPSPTGHLHIGGLRTALFNWLFAQHHQGTFFLRIEDTDLERSSQLFTQSIIDSLNWAGIKTEEPIMYQSKRFDIYRDVALNLIRQGKAYRCFCPPSFDRVSRDYMRYDGKCRAQVFQDNETRPYVIRFKFPQNRTEVSFHDMLRGNISFPADQLDDFIIVRSDGIPVYNFVVVVDDAAMHITHIIRGEDHIPNTPKQVLLYQALDLAIPKFVHVPLILGSSGQPLSKRDAATSVQEYRHNGYLPEALNNYLVRLGWAHGDQEIFTQQELIQFFSLDALNKSGAVFDKEKLDWINSQYIKKESAQRLWDVIQQDVDTRIAEKIPWPVERIIHIIMLYQDRIKTLKALAQQLIDLHQLSSFNQDELEIYKPSLALLQDFSHQLNTIEYFSLEEITAHIKNYAKERGIKFSQVAHMLRFALSGQSEGPSVFGLLAALGKQESLKRVDHVIDMLKK